jgi:Trypsin-co-occurring domain 1
MPAAVVRYELDDGTVVGFEVDPTPDFRPAGPDEIVGKLRAAVAPAVEAARAVLDKAKEATPDQVELTFGIKVSGTMNWLVARAATEGNFEVTLTWKPGSSTGG